METRDTPLLDRDNPDVEPLAGHTKVTRNDWLNIAREILVSDGADSVKILRMAQTLGVSRSSFYWYFENRDDLLNALLREWEQRNTASIVKHCQMPAENISFAVCNFFRCFVMPDVFDPGLDFAIREWARRDEDIRARVDRADALRISTIIALFERFHYPPQEADARARILYYMQLGYHALKVAEPMSLRMERLGPYLKGFLGHAPDPNAIKRFVEDVAADTA